MSAVLSVVAAQVRAIPGDREAAFARFEDVARRAAAIPGTDLIVFPESFLSAIEPGVPIPAADLAAIAEPIPGPLTEHIGRAAAEVGCWILAGTIVERADSGLYHTAIVVSPDGHLAASHRKLFPWRPYEEVEAGAEPTVFDLPGFGRVGLMVGYEAWFPEVPRALALLGAELLLVPTLTTTPDRSEELVLLRAHAIANQCYVVSVNATADIGGGHSLGVDPEGRVLFEAGIGQELIPELIDFDRVRLIRERGTRAYANRLRDLRTGPAALRTPAKETTR